MPKGMSYLFGHALQIRTG